jgi:hypothetical protein
MIQQMPSNICVLHTAYFGWYVDCKNVQSMNNLKFANAHWLTLLTEV